MERITIGQSTNSLNNAARIRKLEGWITEHEKVKHKHEIYMVVIAVMAFTAILMQILL